MESSVAQSASRPRSIDISSLSPEILLPIFLKLNSKEVVIFRRTCKKWLDVIETNKSLWRTLEWIEKSGDSIEKAVEMFDQKSASSLETVSIEEEKAPFQDFQSLIAVISRSRESLRTLSVLTFSHSDERIVDQLLELADSSPTLEKLVLWTPGKAYRQLSPIVRLIPNRKRVDADSSDSRLKVLWFPSSPSESIKYSLQLPTHLFKSLVSFALYGAMEDHEARRLIAKFSESIVHLSLTIFSSGSHMEQALFCPNLKILQGYFQKSPSLYFDCPNLKHLILSFGFDSGLSGISSSVEQLWLRPHGEHFQDQDWEPLLSSCPNMEVLKLDMEFTSSRNSTYPHSESLIQMLENRQEKINKGEEISGQRVVLLQKLVLPLTLLSEDQLKRAQKVAGEVVDIKDYPDFIEMRY